jgi:transcription-repair coupling factor (superfamily II helicase)
MEMLERAVESLKKGEIPDPEADSGRETEVNLRIPALIPEDYLPDINTRLVLYKRISRAGGDSELREIQVEMIDRFGLLPEATRNLFKITQTKLLAAGLGIHKIEAGENGGSIEFSDTTSVNPMALVKLVQTQPQTFRLANGNRLRFEQDISNFEERHQFVNTLLQEIGKDAGEVAA